MARQIMRDEFGRTAKQRAADNRRERNAIRRENEAIKKEMKRENAAIKKEEAAIRKQQAAIEAADRKAFNEQVAERKRQMAPIIAEQRKAQSRYLRTGDTRKKMSLVPIFKEAVHLPAHAEFPLYPHTVDSKIRTNRTQAWHNACERSYNSPSNARVVCIEKHGIHIGYWATPCVAGKPAKLSPSQPEAYLFGKYTDSTLNFTLSENTLREWNFENAGLRCLSNPVVLSNIEELWLCAEIFSGVKYAEFFYALKSLQPGSIMQTDILRGILAEELGSAFNNFSVLRSVVVVASPPQFSEIYRMTLRTKEINDYLFNADSSNRLTIGESPELMNTLAQKSGFAFAVCNFNGDIRNFSLGDYRFDEEYLVKVKEGIAEKYSASAATSIMDTDAVEDKVGDETAQAGDIQAVDYEAVSEYVFSAVSEQFKGGDKYSIKPEADGCPSKFEIDTGRIKVNVTVFDLLKAYTVKDQSNHKGSGRAEGSTQDLIDSIVATITALDEDADYEKSKAWELCQSIRKHLREMKRFKFECSQPENIRDTEDCSFKVGELKESGKDSSQPLSHKEAAYGGEKELTEGHVTVERKLVYVKFNIAEGTYTAKSLMVSSSGKFTMHSDSAECRTPDDVGKEIAEAVLKIYVDEMRLFGAGGSVVGLERVAQHVWWNELEPLRTGYKSVSSVIDDTFYENYDKRFTVFRKSGAEIGVWVSMISDGNKMAGDFRVSYRKDGQWTAPVNGKGDMTSVRKMSDALTEAIKAVVRKHEYGKKADEISTARKSKDTVRNESKEALASSEKERAAEQAKVEAAVKKEDKEKAKAIRDELDKLTAVRGWKVGTAKVLVDGVTWNIIVTIKGVKYKCGFKLSDTLCTCGVDGISDDAEFVVTGGKYAGTLFSALEEQYKNHNDDFAKIQSIYTKLKELLNSDGWVVGALAGHASDDKAWCVQANPASDESHEAACTFKLDDKTVKCIGGTKPDATVSVEKNNYAAAIYAAFMQHYNGEGVKSDSSGDETAGNVAGGVNSTQSSDGVTGTATTGASAGDDVQGNWAEAVYAVFSNMANENGLQAVVGLTKIKQQMQTKVTHMCVMQNMGGIKFLIGIGEKGGVDAKTGKAMGVVVCEAIKPQLNTTGKAVKTLRLNVKKLANPRADFARFAVSKVINVSDKDGGTTLSAAEQLNEAVIIELIKQGFWVNSTLLEQTKGNSNVYEAEYQISEKSRQYGKYAESAKFTFMESGDIQVVYVFKNMDSDAKLFGHGKPHKIQFGDNAVAGIVVVAMLKLREIGIKSKDKWKS